MTREQGASSRRARFGMFSALLLIAATASVIFAAAIADRYSVRIDATATREHSLSARTRTILSQIDAPVEIVVVADQRAMDSRVRQRVGDVLNAFEESSAHVTVTRIDPVTDSGRAEFEALRSRVTDLYAADSERRLTAVQSAAGAAHAMTDRLNALSDALLALEEPLHAANSPMAPHISNVAAAARLQARSLEPIVNEAEALSFDAAAEVEQTRRSLLNALTPLRDQLHQLFQEIADAESSAEPDSEIALGWRRVRELVQSVRDDAARHADALDRLGRSEAGLVLRILESTDAVLILSDGRSTAIPFGSLFPATERINESGGSATDLGFIGEELIATAIASLNRPTTPIVVIVHTLPGRLFDESGAPVSQTRQVMGALLDRLLLRGVTFAEWSVALNSSRPTLARLNPNGDRPIVWFAFGAEGTSAEAAARFDAYATALRSLLNDGQSVLVSVAPSTRPASGASDPVAQALQSVGVEARTGKPLIRSLQASTGEAFDLSFIVREGRTGNRLGQTITGLPLMLTWATVVAPIEGSGAEVIAQIEPSDRTWGEAEWRSLAGAPDDRPWTSAAPPTPNPAHDDVNGPWPIAVSIERAAGLGARTQRVVAIGSSGWFFDRIASRTATTEGRTVTRYPGNLELLEASVHWLAGQDALVAGSARSAEIPRIGPMTDAQLAAARWGLIFGLPAMVLLLGVVMRLTVLR